MKRTSDGPWNAVEEHALNAHVIVKVLQMNEGQSSTTNMHVRCGSGVC